MAFHGGEYTLGETVEYREDSGETWLTGFVQKIDDWDHSQMYGIVTPGDADGGREWPDSHNLRRALTPTPVLQWRYIYASGMVDHSEWMNVTPGTVLAPAAIARVEFRVKPTRNEAEILTKAREVAAAEYGETSHISRVLCGGF